jgi:pimeloyl-[acyl-carrier protein] methyl ester esterase
MQALSGERLVFLPGLDGTGISYEPLGPFIAADADVTVVRYPLDEPLSFRETVECAASQVGAADGSVVVAESFSGPVAVELVGSGQLKPKCLVLCATFARSPRRGLLSMARRLPLANLMGLPIPDGFLRFAMGGTEFAPLLLPMWYRVKDMVSPKILAHRLDLVSRVDVRRWLPQLTMPCCYIQAIGDALVPPKASLDSEAGVRNFELKTLRGPHFLLQARPRESVRIIETFNHHTTPAIQADRLQTARSGVR